MLLLTKYLISYGEQSTDSWIGDRLVLICCLLYRWVNRNLAGGFVHSSVKENTRSSGGASGEITSWHKDSDAWCQQVISRLAPPDERVFSFYTVLTYGINNKSYQ